jgi:hypothetical protein
MRSFTRKARPGFTTGELMIAVGLLSIFTTALYSVLLCTLGIWDSATSKSLSDTAASLALQRVARDVMYGASATFSGNILTVTMSDGSSLQFYLSDRTLYRRPGSSGSAVALATGITAFTPTLARNDGTDPTVTLAITAQARTGKTGRQTQFSEVVALRNRDTN